MDTKPLACDDSNYLSFAEDKGEQVLRYPDSVAKRPTYVMMTSITKKACCVFSTGVTALKGHDIIFIRNIEGFLL